MKKGKKMWILILENQGFEANKLSGLSVLFFLRRY